MSGEPEPGTVGSPYDFSCTVTGSPAPRVAVLSGRVPPGLGLDAAGRPTGTPTAAGTYAFTVRAESASGVADATSMVTIAEAPVAPALSGAATDGVVGSSYDFGYTVSGTPTPTVSVAAGTPPPGLSLSAAGRLTGSPTTAGTYPYRLSAVNSAGTTEIGDSITISAAAVCPDISGLVAAGIVRSAYDYSYSVTASRTPTVSVTSGTLPPGLTLDASGRLTGTPTVAGTYTFTVRAENSAGVDRATSTLTVAPPKATAKADLRVDLSGAGSVVKGRTSTYTLTTTNAGPAASASVYSKVILPSNVQLVSATGRYTRIGNLVVFQRSSLADGRTVIEKITVEATSTGRGTARAGTFSAKTPDPSIRGNADTVTITVR